MSYGSWSILLVGLFISSHGAPTGKLGILEVADDVLLLRSSRGSEGDRALQFCILHIPKDLEVLALLSSTTLVLWTVHLRTLVSVLALAT